MISKRTAIIQCLSIVLALSLIFLMFGTVVVNNHNRYNLFEILFIPSLIFLSLGSFGIVFTVWQYQQKEDNDE